MLSASWGRISVFHIKAQWLAQVSVNFICPLISFCWFEMSIVFRSNVLEHWTFTFANTESCKILLEKYIKSALLPCNPVGLSDHSVMEILMNLQLKVRRKGSLEENTQNLLWVLPCNQGFRKLFQMKAASLVTHGHSKPGKSKSRGSARITIFMCLHIFINLTGFKLYSGRKGFSFYFRIWILIVLHFRYKACKHTTTLKLFAVYVRNKKKNHFDQFTALKCPLI